MAQDQGSIFDRPTVSTTPTPKVRSIFDESTVNTEPLSDNLFDRDIQFEQRRQGTIGQKIEQGIGEFVKDSPTAQRTISTIAPALDFLSRPSYAVNKFIYDYQKPEGKLFESVASAFSELFATGNKRAKLSYSDVIRAKDPEFAYKNPTLTQVIGFIGDVALDPTTYLGIGSIAKGIKVSGGVLNKGGTKLFEKLLPSVSNKVFVAEDGTLQLLQELPKTEKAVQRTIKLAEGFEKRVKDSAVVDDAGELIPLYRGTDTPVERIKGRQGIQGLYFTTLPEVADIYAQEAGSSVVKAYSNAKKLLDLNEPLSEDIIKIGENILTKNSKVKDYVYHGTGSDFTEFKTSGFGDNSVIESGAGAYFTNDPSYAQRFAQGSNPKVIKTKINLENPHYSDLPLNHPQNNAIWNEIQKIDPTININTIKQIPSVKTSNDLLILLGNTYWQEGLAKTENEGIELATNALKANGFDGIINKSGKFEEYIIFDPKQNILSGNRTTEEYINALRNKLSTEPLVGQNKLINELKKYGYQGMKFISDDGGIPHQQYLIFSERNIIPAYTNRGLRAKEAIEKGTGAIGKLEEQKAILTKAGYFDAVASKQSEINKIFTNILQGNPDATTAKMIESLAKAEILGDIVKTEGRQSISEILGENEVYEKLTDRMGKLFTANPSLMKQYLEPKALYLKVGVPFGQQHPLMKIFGTEYLYKQIQAMGTYINETNKAIPKALLSVGRVFSRDLGLPEEYVRLRNELENEFSYLSDEMIRQTRKLFTGISPEGRERIGSAMHWADDETRKLQEIRQASADPNFRTLTDGEAAQVFQQGAEKFKLTPEEFAVMTGIQQAYKEAGLLEMRAGLLKYNLVNYSARGYEIIKDAEDFSLITRGKYGSAIPQPYLASSKQRKFLTKEEAEAAGLVPELDAAILYAHRLLSSQRALAVKSFKDSVIEIFGTYDPRIKTAHTGILPTAVLEERLPARVISDMKMIGSSVIPSGINDLQRTLLRVIDKAQGLWKRGATTVRPTFAPKQLISNTFQSAMILGAKAFKAFDPRVAIDAAILTLRGGKALDNLPPFLTNWITSKFTGNKGLDAILAGRVILDRHLGDVLTNDFLSKFEKTTTLGQKFTGTELVELAREKGVIRGFDSTGESYSKKVGEALTRQSNSHWSVVKELSKVWNHAGYIEDYSRMMLFLNGIGMGYSADEAVKLVNKALFDYQRGLSHIERNVIRRVLPFYSFQRFAIPFVLKSTMEQPGNVATVEKLMRTTEKLLITGEDLTAAEQDIFNSKGENPILEQPRLLSGFDKDGTATLNILNNFTPWDVLSLFVYDKQGEIDVSRTMERTFLSALTPYLKIPATMATQRDFFTGRTIDEAKNISGNLDYSIGKVIPDWAKELMGWEVRTHQVTGKTKTYLNPFMGFYAMQFVPALREYIKPMTELDKQKGNWLTSIVHYTRKLLDPINEQKYDFAYQEQQQWIGVEKDLADIEKGLVLAKIRGDQVGTDTSFEFQDNWKRLQTLLQTIDDRTKNRIGTVRGPGIQGILQEGQDLPNETPQTVEPTFK